MPGRDGASTATATASESPHSDSLARPSDRDSKELEQLPIGVNPGRVTVHPGRGTGSLRPLRPVPARPIRVMVRPQGVRYRGHGCPTFLILTRTENPAGTVNFQIVMGKDQNFEYLYFRGSS